MPKNVLEDQKGHHIVTAPIMSLFLNLVFFRDDFTLFFIAEVEEENSTSSFLQPSSSQSSKFLKIIYTLHRNCIAN